MAKYASSPNSRIWLDQYDLTGFLNMAGLNVRQGLIVVTALSDGGPRRLVDNYDHDHEFTAMVDFADDSADEILHALVGSEAEHYLAECLGANAEGSVVYDAIGRLAGKPMVSNLGAAHLINGRVEGSAGLSRGLVIRNATVSANGNGTGRNVGASTAGQTFQAIVRVFSGTFTSFDVNIQESSDDGGGDLYATIAGMTQAVTAAGVWRLTTTAATEAWKRVNIANWIGASAVIAVTCGIVQGT